MDMCPRIGTTQVGAGHKLPAPTLCYLSVCTVLGYPKRPKVLSDDIVKAIVNGEAGAANRSVFLSPSGIIII